MRSSAARQGFTLLEILVVIVVLGLLGSVIVGGFTNVVPAGREAAAVNKARIINAARLTFALTVPDAPAQWAAASTDTERSSLLIGAGALTGTAADWVVSAGGYRLAMTGTLRDKTVLRDSSERTLSYPD